jgi:pimeloyl-ACP methyl ester carboxylesterase
MRVVFVHGIGATEKVWQKTIGVVGKRYKCSAITFADRFGHPEQQVEELAEYLKQFKKEELILVCHSLGGLVARKYLTTYRPLPAEASAKAGNNIKKLILLGTPNLGIFGLLFNWVPLFLEIVLSIIALATERYGIFWLVIAASLYDFFSYLRGVKLICPATSAMQPTSRFLKELNSQKLPDAVQYIAILCRPWFHLQGDGAVSLESQRLSEKCVPNFKELNYQEVQTTLPHFAEPEAADVILAALR